MLIIHSPKPVFISQTSTYLHLVRIVNLLHMYPSRKTLQIICNIKVLVADLQNYKCYTDLSSILTSRTCISVIFSIIFMNRSRSWTRSLNVRCQEVYNRPFSWYLARKGIITFTTDTNMYNLQEYHPQWGHQLCGGICDLMVLSFTSF